MFGVFALAVVLLVSFVVFANAQDKKVVKKMTEKVEKAVKGEKAKCCPGTTDKKCSDATKKAHSEKCCTEHKKDVKKSECCTKVAPDCKTKCPLDKAKKDKK